MGFTNQAITVYETSSLTTPSSAMTQNLQTHAINIANTKTAYCLQASWTGTPVGTVSFMGSTDGINFLATLATVAAGGAVGSLDYDNFGSALQAVKVVYAFSSSTGVLSVQLAKKS
jgi:hypothetical protein